MNLFIFANIFKLADSTGLETSAVEDMILGDEKVNFTIKHSIEHCYIILYMLNNINYYTGRNLI
jgi:hypothetical protein